MSSTHHYHAEIARLLNKNKQLQDRISKAQSRATQKLSIIVAVLLIIVFVGILVLTNSTIYFTATIYHIGLVITCLVLLVFAAYSIMHVRTKFHYDQLAVRKSIRRNLSTCSDVQALSDTEIDTIFNYIHDYAHKTAVGRMYFEPVKYAELIQKETGKVFEPDLIDLLYEAQNIYFLEDKLEQLQKITPRRTIV